MSTILVDIERAVAPLGMIVRGGFHPEPADAVPGVATADATLILIGNTGSAMWEPFDRAWPDERRAQERHPLNTWTREAMSPIAAAFAARALYPFDSAPYLPFQRWATRAEGLRSSPLGPLLHPMYGQWHAYRAALVFSYRIAVPPPEPMLDLCGNCPDKSCLSGCPVGAFTGNSYDVPGCAGHLVGKNGAECMERGCLARRACPVGREHLYRPEHARFHMQKFRLSHIHEARVS
jgi:hypothetical protein